MEFVHVDEPVTNFDKYYRLGCKPCHFFVNYTIRNFIDEAEHEKAKCYLAEEWNKRASIRQPEIIVRCKDCKHRGNSEKCVLSAISEEKDFPLFMLDNHGAWFCGDGETDNAD